MSSIMDIARTALDAFGKKVDVTANNLANVNTEGFKKSRATLQEGEPSGVIVSISKVDAPGPLIPADNGSEEMLESSNVDIAGEVVDLTITQHAYQANLKTLETEDEMLGSLFDSLG
jgi:flagellar basal body rod protein FlgG